MTTPTNVLLTARTRRAPQPWHVTIGLGLALALAAVAAPRLGITPPVAWLITALMWLGVRFVAFETARAATLPVARWRLGSDIASPSIEPAPEDNLAWPVLTLDEDERASREVAAPFGYYLYEFRSKENVDADLPAALPVRVRETPLGAVIMPDDRAYVLVGPALFAALMLLLVPLWPAFVALVT